jgi:hypothetical protein
VLFPSIHVLQLQLILLFQYCSLLPSLLPMVSTDGLKFLYSFLNNEHINLIQGFGFFPLPYLSLAQPPLSVTHVP